MFIQLQQSNETPCDTYCITQTTQNKKKIVLKQVFNIQCATFMFCHNKIIFLKICLIIQHTHRHQKRNFFFVINRCFSNQYNYAKPKPKMHRAHILCIYSGHFYIATVENVLRVTNLALYLNAFVPFLKYIFMMALFKTNSFSNKTNKIPFDAH